MHVPPATAPAERFHIARNRAHPLTTGSRRERADYLDALDADDRSLDRLMPRLSRESQTRRPRQASPAVALSHVVDGKLELGVRQRDRRSADVAHHPRERRADPHMIPQASWPKFGRPVTPRCPR